MWKDAKSVDSSNYEHVPSSNQRDSIQVLRPTKVYHFDDTNACSVKNHEDNLIEHLKKLPIIFNHHVFNLKKISI